MGMMVPAYGYYSAQGSNRNRHDNDGKRIERSKLLLDTFFDFLRHPFVKNFAVDKRVVYGRKEDSDLREIDWRGPTICEIDLDTRPKLTKLLEKIEDRGTLVIPTFEHLRTGNRYCYPLLDRLCKNSLAPVSAQDLMIQIRFLEEDLRRPLTGLHRRKFEDNLLKFFHSVTNSAVQVQRQLENSRLRRRPSEDAEDADLPATID